MKYAISYISSQNAKVRKANKEKYSELGYAVALMVVMSAFFIGGLAI